METLERKTLEEKIKECKNIIGEYFKNTAARDIPSTGVSGRGNINSEIANYFSENGHKEYLEHDDIGRYLSRALVSCWQEGDVFEGKNFFYEIDYRLEPNGWSTDRIFDAKKIAK